MAIKHFTLVAALAVTALAGMGQARAGGLHWLRLGPPKIVLSLYGEHVSHLTQHAPFAAHPTNYGYNTVNLGITFEEHGMHGGGPFLTLAEGYNLTAQADESHYTGQQVPICIHVMADEGCYSWPVYSGQRAYGALLGPREVFSARIGWRWVL